MKKITFLAIALFLLSGINQSALAQSFKGENGSITVMSPLGTSVKQNRQLVKPKQSSSQASLSVSNSEQTYFALKFDRTLSIDDEKILTLSKIHFYGYLGENTYVLQTANLDKSLAALIEALKTSEVKVEGISPIPAQFKIKSPLYSYLKDGKDVPFMHATDGIYVHTYQKSDLPALKKTLSNNDIVFAENSEIHNSVVVHALDAATLLQIAELNYVSGLEKRVLPKPEWTFNMSWITHPNQIAMVNYGMNGPIGRGVYFGNWETYGGRAEYQVAYRGREIEGKIDRDPNSHGTDIADIVGAANNINEYEGQGMAPGVKIIAMNGNANIGYTDAVAPNHAAGYKPLVANHSVGWSVGQAGYNSASAALDNATYTYPTFIQSYSAGNSGATGETHNSMVFPDYQSITGDIKTNKNNFTVGSNGKIAQIVGFSSFGPTLDGRVKPDLCAEGTGGTSYAAPSNTGMAAVMFEVYANTYNEAVRSDVVKAVMMNTTIDMYTKGIDFKTGYGQINPRRAVESLSSKNLAKDYSVPQGTTGFVSHKIEIPEGTAEARILLYWHDYPGTPGAAKALVNDLDLEVATPSGDIIYPWVLNPRPERVKDLPTQKRDSLNNVEQVTFENPAAGTYTIRVKGKSVVRGPQKFVITWDSKPAHIRMNSHPDGFKLMSGANTFISWDLITGDDISTKTVDVFFRASDTQEFRKIGSVTGKLYLDWTVPANTPISSTAQFKVVHNGMESTSGNCQVMNTPENFRLLSFCGTQAKFTWDELPNFTGKYILYSLGENYMEAVDSVDQSSTVLTLNAPEGKPFDKSSFFAIAARDASSGALSLRSIAITPDPFNNASNDAAFSTENYLCYGDTLHFGPQFPEGDVKWFKDGLPFETTDRTLKLTRETTGKFHYTVGSDACSFTSDPINIYAKDINPNDTIQSGYFKWNGYVFQGGNSNSFPLYGQNPKYYGTFELNKLGFNSNDDLFEWSKSHNNISTYYGCPLPDKWNTVVMKRKGFVEGRYSIILRRASQRVRVTVSDSKSGTVIRDYKSTVNFSGTASIMSLVPLNEDSEIRLEWFGDHCVIDIVRSAVIPMPAPKNPPGNISNGLTAWVHSGNAQASQDGTVNGVLNGVPQNTLILPDRNDPGITLDKSGLNFNPTLLFSGKGGLKGYFEKAYTGNAVADYVTFKLDNRQQKNWARVLSVGGTVENDWDNLESYVAIERIGTTTGIGSMRKDVQTPASGVFLGPWQSMMVQQNAGAIKITNKGGTAATSTGSDANFNLLAYTIGVPFDPKDAVEMNGQVAEFLHFNRALTLQEESKINTYLALKYGLTQTGHYIDAKGDTIVYPDAVYKNNIAGVVSDSTQSLVQKQAKSEDQAIDILIGSIGQLAASNSENTANFAQDNTYMIWSNNGKSPTMNTTTNVSNRIWKLVAPKNKQTLRVHIRKTGIPGNANTELKLHIIVSTSDDFATEKIYLAQETTDAAGTPYMYADIPVENDVQYVSFGYRIPTGLQDILNAQTHVIYDAASKQIRVKTQLEANRIDVISVTGNLLKSISAESGTTYIPASDLSSGSYIVRVIRADGSGSNHKLLVK